MVGLRRQSLVQIAFFSVVAALGSASAWARFDLVPGPRYTSARAAAMGDAYSPIGDDGATMLFYNPSAVGRAKDPQIEALNVGVYGNSDFFSTVSLTNLSFYRIYSLTSYLPTLRANPGKFAGAGVSVFPNFSSRLFAFGVLWQSQMAGRVNNDGTVTYRSQYLFIPTLSTGIRLAGGIVRVGYNLQWVNQAAGQVNNVPDTTSPLEYNASIAQGSGFSHNFGLSLTFPVRLLPQLSIVARNVLGTQYSSFSMLSFAQNPSGVPTTEPMTIDAAFSVQPKIGSGSYMNIVFEGRDLSNTSQMDLMGRLSLGMEFSYRDQFFLRGGWRSGYPSLGMGLRRTGSEFSFTWYSEEMGTHYNDLRDSRWLVQYQVRAF